MQKVVITNKKITTTVYESDNKTEEVFVLHQHPYELFDGEDCILSRLCGNSHYFTDGRITFNGDDYSRTYIVATDIKCFDENTKILSTETKVFDETKFSFDVDTKTGEFVLKPLIPKQKKWYAFWK